MTTNGLIDTDVHVAPSDFAELAAYLPQYWQRYAEEGGVRLTARQRGDYPPPDEAPQGDARTPARAAELAALDQDEHGPVAAAVLTCTVLFDFSRSAQFEAVGARAVNSWTADVLLDEDPRLFGSAVIPTLDVEEAVTEIQRVAENPRFVRILLPVRNEFRYGEPSFRPVLEAAAEAGLVVCLHSGGRTGLSASPTGYHGSFVEDMVVDQHRAAQNQLVSLVSSGVLARVDGLRLTVAECGFSWLAPLLWRLDKDWKSLWREVPWLDREPSYLVRDRVRFTLEPAHLPPDDEALREAAALCEAPRVLMYSSDFPHRYESAARHLLGTLGEEDRQQVLHGNARDHYRRLAMAGGA
ncbi:MULTISPECIES: amidohydrolase family protein [Streptomyces]|uniref:Putative metal-dependent hydrolase of the TIM-barrel fold protein n=1 Tax=Streptomyces chartreusis NRRL 3882 TaxID=1079985 RepID=A0A2N9B375_STRCX|nr:amidohydrolase family protein [Streptomyces chartreusis]MYS89681.1 amidohydrolase family protein [Streptomyces sp. SID5464]SOR77806.1 putative metal-dependent hydrolase of the TIM-barrel fold protein [Streptomyces chartreusis NRRL 3882]